MAFSLDSKVKDILKNPAAAAVLDKYSPDASRNPQMKLVGGLTLRKLASFPQSAFLNPRSESRPFHVHFYFAILKALGEKVD